jgi:hypothetical protein
MKKYVEVGVLLDNIAHAEGITSVPVSVLLSIAKAISDTPLADIEEIKRELGCYNGNSI